MKLALFFLVSLVAASSCLASVTLSASGTLASPTNAGLNGLVGAVFTVQTVFSGTNYVDDGSASPAPGLPVAIGDNALTTLTISGAADPGLNGTYAHYSGSTSAHYYPGYAGLYGGAADFGILYFDLGLGDYVGMGLWSDPTSSGELAVIGGEIQLADFGTGPILPPAGQNETYLRASIGGQVGDMSIIDGSFSVVPEPGPAALALLGFAGLARRRRCC
jgi:MYXO-CTERM domain-containing protein